MVSIHFEKQWMLQKPRNFGSRFGNFHLPTNCTKYGGRSEIHQQKPKKQESKIE